MFSNISAGYFISISDNITAELNRIEKLYSGLVSDEDIQYFYTIYVAIVCTSCCLFGIVTNILNIFVFVRMGFKETINIALIGLAISDLCSLISLLWLCICFNPLFMYSDVPILTFEVQHKTGGWTHITFTRVTAFVTVYITLERCLCIAFPLKVKSLLTPKRVFFIIVGIYVVIIGSLSQNYTNFRLIWKFVPSLNRTMFGMIYTENRLLIQTVTYVLNVFYMTIAFTGVISCSSVLIWKLNQRNKWLHTTASGQEKSSTTRDRQVIKMVVCVAVVFIINFTPSVVLFLAVAIEPELNMGKRYQNLFLICVITTFIFDAINSSVNIFVYYKMSSKYAFRLRSLITTKMEKFHG